MEDNHLFCVAGHRLLIRFTGQGDNSIGLLPSFAPFASGDGASGGDAPGDLLFTLTVDDSLRPARERKLVRAFDTGNGDTIVHRLPDGGHQFIVKDIRNHSCCLLQADASFANCRCALNGTRPMRQFGLNNALMLVFAFAASKLDTLLIHASCVAHGGRAYPFTAKSGTGKSTHSNLWMTHIEGTELVNDDNPIIRLQGDTAVLYGSPWSGKTPCYRNISLPLGALTRIERAPRNSIERLRPVEAFASILPACSSMKWDSAIYNNLLDTITKLVATVPAYTMHCLPDKEAALICHNTISRQAQ